MCDCVSSGFPVIVFVDVGGFGGVAYALYSFQLYCFEVGGWLKIFPFIRKNISMLLLSGWNQLHNQKTHQIDSNLDSFVGLVV